MAYELGYRLQPLEHFFLDIATFYNVYNDLSSLEPGVPFFEPTPLPSHLVIPQYHDNKAHGRTYGIEVASTWNVTPWWKVAAGYTWFESRLRRDPSGKDSSVTASEGNDAHNQFNFRSYVNLPWRLEFDTMLYYVDNLPNLQIPSYVRLDLRVGWHLTDNHELSLVGQNLIDDRHPEFHTFSGLHSTETERGMYGKITWKF